MTYRPDFLFVQFTQQAQYNAVQQLVRPWEVAHLFTPPTSPMVAAFLPPLAERVAEWLQRNINSKVFSYQSDPPGLDCWYAPSVTLRRRGGDCEDFALLVVSMLVSQGVHAELAIGTYSNGYSSTGHAWVEGRDEQGGFLIEGTSGAIYRRTRPDQYTLMWKLAPSPITVRRVA